MVVHQMRNGYIMMLIMIYYYDIMIDITVDRRGEASVE